MGSFIKQRSPNDGEDILGLQNHGYVLFPDSETEMEIPYINRRYKLGNSPDTKHKFGLTPKLQQEFEQEFGVEFDSPEGQEFLNSWRIKLSHLTNPIDEGDVNHRFNLSILRANDGMGLVNMGQDEMAKMFPFELIDENKETDQKHSRVTIRNEAIAALQELSIKSKEKMVKIAKYLFNLNAEITDKNAYIKLDEFILSKGSNAEMFLQTLKLDPEWVETTVLVKDAMNAGFIRRGEDQYYINVASQIKMGRSIEEITKYLMNPDNQDQLGTGSKNDQPYSLRTQFKNRIN